MSLATLEASWRSERRFCTLYRCGQCIRSGHEPGTVSDKFDSQAHPRICILSTRCSHRTTTATSTVAFFLDFLYLFVLERFHKQTNL